MTIENEPSAIELHDIEVAAFNEGGGAYWQWLKIWRAGHARGVANERARSAIDLAEVKAQADYITDALTEQVAGLKAQLESWRVSCNSAELSILRNEKAKREGERGPRPSYEELSRIAHRGLTGDESIVDGLRRERMNLFDAGVAWAESGRAEQPPRVPRPTGEELCDQYELIHPGVRAGGFAEYCFLAGAAWAESGLGLSVPSQSVPRKPA